MKKIMMVAAVLAILAGCGKKDNAPAPLQVKGTALYAGENEVRLKGVSFGWHNIWPRFYNEGSVKELTEVWGARFLRAAIGSDDHAMADNPGIHDGYIGESDFALDCLYKVVDAAIAQGVYVIVDWHSHTLHPEAAKEFFTKVATRYKDNTNVIYELFNEPVSREFETSRDYSQPTNESLVAYWNDLKAYSEELIGIITGISNVHPLILVGCPQWDQDIHLVPDNPITCYDNIMYTVHFYAATHKDYLRERSDYALSRGIPVFISECAACEASGDGFIDVESWEEWDNWAAQRNISMAVWSISDKVESCSMLVPGANENGAWSEDQLKFSAKLTIDWLKK